MVKLVISDSEGATTVVPLVRDEITIGRKEGNTIRLTERNVSRKHAQLRRVNGAYKLKDLDSYVGTLVNGARVEVEAEIGPGDTIEIGDYRIAVEREGELQAAPPIEDEPTRVTQMRVPARFVVLDEPTPGALFALPEQGSVRIGRGDEPGIRIEHPSVSREHVEIERVGDRYRVRDLGSANGMRVGGERVSEAMLGSGDVLELGKVLLRFVPAGEVYEFDPTEALQYAPRRPRTALWAGVGGAVVALGIVVVIVTSGGGDEVPEAVASTPVAVAPEPSAAPTPAPAPVPAAAPGVPDDGYDRDLADCRSALQAGRFVEAIAHANEALATRPGAPDADRCRNDAQRGAEDEQAFVRGKAALDRDDAEGAYREFSALAPDSPFRGRAELAQALDALGAARVERARAALGRNPGEAARIASSVLDVPDMPDAQVQQAREVLTRAQAAEASKPSGSRATASKSGATETRETQASGGKSAMDAAGECLAAGDNECVVRVLKGRARTAQELGLLIETYRAMGQVEEAQKQMAVYVKRFPTARRAEAYQSMLGRPN